MHFPAGDTESNLLEVVETEAAAVAADYPDPRRTHLVAVEDVGESREGSWRWWGWWS